MAAIDQVTFRKHDGGDVCEIPLTPYRGGTVGVFPANEVVPGSDPAQTYAEKYKVAFDAYKSGDLQPSEIAALPRPPNVVLDFVADWSKGKPHFELLAPKIAAAVRRGANLDEAYRGALAGMKAAKPKAKAKAHTFGGTKKKAPAKKAAKKRAKSKK